MAYGSTWIAREDYDNNYDVNDYTEVQDDSNAHSTDKYEHYDTFEMK